MVEIDINSRPDVATHYMVQSIPTFILFDHGKEIKRFVGIQPKESLEKILNAILSDRH
jgi:thioredoxin 1